VVGGSVVLVCVFAALCVGLAVLLGD